MKVPITISIKECDAEAKASGEPQCRSVFVSSGFIFCLRPQGHAGDHRGLRAQWNGKQAGQ